MNLRCRFSSPRRGMRYSGTRMQFPPFSRRHFGFFAGGRGCARGGQAAGGVSHDVDLLDVPLVFALLGSAELEIQGGTDRPQWHRHLRDVKRRRLRRRTIAVRTSAILGFPLAPQRRLLQNSIEQPASLSRLRGRRSFSSLCFLKSLCLLRAAMTFAKLQLCRSRRSREAQRVEHPVPSGPTKMAGEGFVLVFRHRPDQLIGPGLDDSRVHPCIAEVATAVSKNTKCCTSLTRSCSKTHGRSEC